MNMADALDRTRASNPLREAVICKEVRLTYAGLWSEASRVAAGLAGLGVAKGDRVCLFLNNRAEFVVAHYATMKLGAICVSLSHMLKADEVRELVNDCAAKVLITETALAEHLPPRAQNPSVQTLVGLGESGEVDCELDWEGLHSTEGLDTDGGYPTCATTANDPATIIYTSGTTGPPKGVMLSHRNIAWTLESVGQSMRDQTDIDDFAGKKHLSYLPMAHVMERLLGHYYMVDFATTVACCPDTSQLSAYLGEVKPNVFIGVPRVWEKLYAGVNAALAADEEKATQFADAVAAAAPIMEKMTRGTATEEEIGTWNFLNDVAFTTVRGLVGLDEVEIGITGAAPIPAEILEWFRAIGVPLTEGYGMSETTAVLSWANAAKPGYVGTAATGVEIKIADDGEILARGGNMFEGYLGLDDKTAETIDGDGWVHTGDIGEMDDDGYLKIVDRKKELIITAGGKNVSPANLEAALKMIPLVGQACAIGDQKPFISALVVIDPDEARAFCAERGLTGDDATLEALATNPDVISIVEGGLAEAMADFNNAEGVKKVKILGEEWLPDSELLTPTSKLKRRGIHDKFAAEIEALYAK